MTVRRTEVPNSPIFVREDSQRTMPALQWGSFLSIVDGSLNPVPMSDLDKEVLKELMTENGALPSMTPKRDHLSTLRSLLRVTRAIMK